MLNRFEERSSFPVVVRLEAGCAVSSVLSPQGLTSNELCFVPALAFLLRFS